MSEICKDLRHVCGGCGFKWPERSAYDALTSEIAALRERVATLEARSHIWKRVAHRMRSRWLGMLTAYRTEKARADTAESRLAILLPVVEYYASIYGNTRAQEALAQLEGDAAK